MKKLILLIQVIVFFLAFSDIYPQSGWYSQFTGTANILYDVSFTNENTGIVVGLENTVFTTTNGGTNWIIQTSGITNHLYGVSFTDINLNQLRRN